jgi:hypothetical protein
MLNRCPVCNGHGKTTDARHGRRRFECAQEHRWTEVAGEITRVDETKLPRGRPRKEQNGNQAA